MSLIQQFHTVKARKDSGMSANALLAITVDTDTGVFESIALFQEVSMAPEAAAIADDKEDRDA